MFSGFFYFREGARYPLQKDINPSFPKYQSKQERICASWKQQSITWQTAEHGMTPHQPDAQESNAQKGDTLPVESRSGE